MSTPLDALGKYRRTWRILYWIAVLVLLALLGLAISGYRAPVSLGPYFVK